ncbi:hypothetical protein [Frigoriglobus tundricola]|uniref:Uncharacterized protein n=1 Tax=Frigoriglobus tundricola TaxID=2774151 RepID=A0A6M5YSH2_9BACT|nr:hypothetical protein [Frigoriglobus tundricola]QJW96231.1 hypothetical protein FTUN_3788 [Frigoriglobus tundricola]
MDASTPLRRTSDVPPLRVGTSDFHSNWISAMAEPPLPPVSPPNESVVALPLSAEQRRVAAIQANLLRALGRPPQLLRVSVTPLWSDHFRVNIFVGDDGGGVAIPYSFFLTADDRGTILRATPPVQRAH